MVSVNYLATDFDKWVSKIIEDSVKPEVREGSLYSEKTFWPASFVDLSSVEKNLVIMSPFSVRT